LKIGGLANSKLKPAIQVNNLYLGIEGTKTNLENIRQFLEKLQGTDQSKNDEFDQLEKELNKHTPACKT
jgi:ribosomal protein S2